MGELLRLNSTVVTSFWVQLKKAGPGLVREACLGEGIYVEIFDLEKGFIVAHKSLKDIKKCKYETLYEDW